MKLTNSVARIRGGRNSTDSQSTEHHQYVFSTVGTYQQDDVTFPQTVLIEQRLADLACNLMHVVE